MRPLYHVILKKSLTRDNRKEVRGLSIAPRKTVEERRNLSEKVTARDVRTRAHRIGSVTHRRANGMLSIE